MRKTLLFSMFQDYHIVSGPLWNGNFDSAFKGPDSGDPVKGERAIRESKDPQQSKSREQKLFLEIKIQLGAKATFAQFVASPFFVIQVCAALWIFSGRRRALNKKMACGFSSSRLSPKR